MAEVQYGVLDAAAIAGLSGLETLRGMIEGRFPRPPISKLMDMWLAEVGEGTAVFEARPGAQLLNPLGSVHGGWALTLIDSACGCAVHSELDPGIGYTTVETKVNFTRPIPPGATVRCEGRVLSRGRTIATADAYLRDGAGRLLAHGTSTLILLPRRA